ncbi:NAD-dependent epimerase/dehydratase family protein [Kaistella sp. 97-N-M2]|uniref:NAD-dependent epimerase/dehydratase family protein n=1 Tax=Kaistella sp. 97-N-M2 TaxID=2908645 RepID=UPI001F1E5D69|nr:NAD-dependent epimerase/dehydratase family protein [Kaistella sp. 97-N-M2]UJF28814.1 NAD-dependent epimerase/dehydratase family protein [Kaistella sp. 97-N-M2]
MKIIITGATGFVGSNLSKYLEDKGNIVGKLSLRNPEFTLNKNADVIIHLAGKAHDTANTSADDEYFKVNRDLTIKLFDEFLNSEIKDFIFFSSVKATADTIEGILHENHPSDPKTPYGKSKFEAENYLFSKQLRENKRLFIIRPCMIHGPGNKGNLNLLYQMIRKGLPWPLAAFENKRSFLSIDNLSFLVSEIIEKKSLPSGVYNFADDQAISTNQLVNLISAGLGKKTKMWTLPKSIILALSKGGDVLKLPLNTERLSKLTDNYVVSNEKIKKALNIESLPLTTEEGIIKTLKSFKK